MHIGVGLMVLSSRICMFAEICGKATRRDLWSSFYSRRGNK